MYDFEGDTENGELVLREGDILIVTNKVSYALCVCVCVCVCVRCCVTINTIAVINSSRCECSLWVGMISSTERSVYSCPWCCHGDESCHCGDLPYKGMSPVVVEWCRYLSLVVAMLLCILHGVV